MFLKIQTKIDNVKGQPMSPSLRNSCQLKMKNKLECEVPGAAPEDLIRGVKLKNSFSGNQDLNFSNFRSKTINH
jgi:hypothetical protein